MVRSFATSDDQSSAHLRPLRVASSKHGVYEEAKNLVHDLRAWRLLQADDDRLTLTCERAGGLLRGRAIVTITVEGPEGIPSATVNVVSQCEGGFPGFRGERAAVAEFMQPFHRRVC